MTPNSNNSVFINSNIKETFRDYDNENTGRITLSDVSISFPKMSFPYAVCLLDWLRKIL